MAGESKHDRARALLLERERRGVRALTIVRGAVLAMLTVVVWSLGASFFEAIVTSVICLALLVVMVVFLRLLSQGKAIRAIGLTGCLIDVAFLAALPVIWYLGVGGAEVPPAYMLKTQTTVFILVAIAFNAIALRPLYPAIVAVGGLLIEAVLLFYILADPRTVLSSDFVASIMGEALTPDLVASNLLTIMIMGIAMGYLAHVARRTVVDGVQLEVVNNQLGRYFSPGIVKSIAADADMASVAGGRSQDVAVMFCDIRNFTALSETLAPSDVVAFLSSYHTRMVEVIFAHGGSIDKFIGDAIMVTFGTPDPAPDDAERAVRAGLAMQAALAQLNDERRDQGLDPIRHGIGIHFGPVIAGNIGTQDRLEYTVIGDAVNVASRIQSLCKTIDRTLLISEAVQSRLPDDITVEALPEQPVRGRSATVRVFAVRH